MGRLVDPKRWENKWHFPPWLGVVLVVFIVRLLAVVPGLYRAFTAP